MEQKRKLLSDPEDQKIFAQLRTSGIPYKEALSIAYNRSAIAETLSITKDQVIERACSRNLKDRSVRSLLNDEVLEVR